MPLESPNERFELPAELRSRLEALQRRVWIIKLAEGVLAALFGLLVSYLLVFLLDRLWDTPAGLRALILVLGTTGLGIWLPLKWHRWVWRTRRLEQVARLLRYRWPRLSDRLLGIVELVQSQMEQQRSAVLCRAAMRQVDHEIRDYDLASAVPYPKHRQWAWAAGVPLTLALAALLVVPDAGSNALLRWLMPWRDTDRYTFTQLERLPDELIVPYAEPFSVQAHLADQTVWTPRQASARYGSQDEVRAPLRQGSYSLSVPPQKQADTLTVAAGDARKTIRVRPTLRPELTAIQARVQLPEYLQHSEDQVKDIRGGSVSLLKGSAAALEATATRQLARATLDGVTQSVAKNRLLSKPVPVHESRSLQLLWEDRLGLSAQEPFVVSITAVDDEAPTIMCSKLAHEQVVLDEDVLNFDLFAEDDFGVQEVGIEWQGIEDPLRNPHPARGEQVLAAGQPEQRELGMSATFSPRRMQIPPQTLEVRLFTVDYLPERKRIYSPTYTLHVLSPEEHAIWLTNQLRKWFLAAQGVYEREQQLHQTNKELRGLTPEQIDQPDNRRRIENQAAAEQANARRLGELTRAGEQLLQQAVRNDQFNVATLETWAGMVQALEAIAAQRMPSVADLLKQAATAPGNPTPAEPSEQAPEPQERGPQVGNNRDGRSGSGKSAAKKGGSRLPTISDVESGFNDLDQPSDEAQPQDDAPPSAGRFTLPSTTIQGGGEPPGESPPPATAPAQQKMEEAVQEQEDLLAEFAKIAEELQKILDNLEGSTFVKRLKAASRRQLEVAGDLNESLLNSFGAELDEIPADQREEATKIAERELAHSDFVYLIQEDLEAYFNRVREGKFKTVLDEMRDTHVVSNIRGIGDIVQDNLSGQGIVEAEFWGDALDRWAEQLVGPG